MTHQRSSGRIRRTGVTEYCRSGIPLVDFDIGRPDHLAPLLGFGGHESSEIGGRAQQRRTTHVGKARLERGVGKRGVDLRVELVDDLRRRGLRCVEAVANTPLVARKTTTVYNFVDVLVNNCSN